MTPKQVFYKPLSNILAFGFGSGLAPVAPGTFGTLIAIPLFLAIAELPLSVYAGITLLSFLAGIVICRIAADSLSSHDHPAIVWDEVVGYFLTMLLIPVSVTTVIAGFLIFRLFDILKPWPIKAIDAQVSGGLGIMLDDVVAGIFANIGLHLLLFYQVLPLL